MLKIIWTLFFGIVIFGLWMIFNYGIQPRSISVLKPSYFDSPQELGELSHQILRPRLALHKVVIIGKQMGEKSCDDILSGFIRHSQESDSGFDVLIVEGSAPQALVAKGLQIIELSDWSEERLFNVLSRELANAKRVLVYMNSLDAVHFEKNSMVHSIENRLKLKIISLASITVSKDVVSQPIEECAQANNKKYVHSLGCLQEKQVHMLSSSRKVKWEKVVGVIEQEGERDYIIYVSPNLKNIEN